MSTDAQWIVTVRYFPSIETGAATATSAHTTAIAGVKYNENWRPAAAGIDR